MITEQRKAEIVREFQLEFKPGTPANATRPTVIVNRKRRLRILGFTG